MKTLRIRSKNAILTLEKSSLVVVTQNDKEDNYMTTISVKDKNHDFIKVLYFTSGIINEQNFYMEIFYRVIEENLDVLNLIHVEEWLRGNFKEGEGYHVTDLVEKYLSIKYKKED